MWKLLFAVLGCMATAWSGAILAVFAIVDETPLNQGLFSIGAAILIAISILCAGYGLSKESELKKRGRFDK